MNLFEKILDTRNLTVIHYLCEEFLNSIEYDSIVEQELVTVRKIQNSNSLDEVWMFCHEHLGQDEEAATLRKWLDGKAFAANGFDATSHEVYYECGSGEKAMIEFTISWKEK